MDYEQILRQTAIDPNKGMIDYVFSLIDRKKDYEEREFHHRHFFKKVSLAFETMDLMDMNEVTAQRFWDKTIVFLMFIRPYLEEPKLDYQYLLRYGVKYEDIIVFTTVCKNRSSFLHKFLSDITVISELPISYFHELHKKIMSNTKRSIRLRFGSKDYITKNGHLFYKPLVVNPECSPIYEILERCKKDILKWNE